MNVTRRKFLKLVGGAIVSIPLLKLQPPPPPTPKGLWEKGQIVEHAIVTTLDDSLKIPTAGIFLISATVVWGRNAKGNKSLTLHRIAPDKPVDELIAVVQSNGNTPGLNLTTLFEKSADDRFEVRVYQDSGALLEVVSSDIMMHRL